MTSATTATEEPRLALRALRTMTPPSQAASLLTTCAVTSGRNLRRFMRTSQILVVGSIQGAMFLLIFRYVLGGAVELSGLVGSEQVSYVDFLVPGYIVSSCLFAGAGTAAGMAEDIDQGFSDRLRSLPITNAAVLAGVSLANTALLGWGLVVTATVGFAIGFRVHGGPVLGLAALGLCALYGFCFMWLFIYLGSVAGSPQAAQNMSMLVFPLSGVSSAWVPVETMPGWMHPVANNQPVTMMTNAVRSLALGDPALAGLDRSTGYWILASLLWCAGLVAVFAPLAVFRFGRA